METEIVTPPAKPKFKMVVIIFLAVMILAALSITSFVLISTLSNDKIYDGVYVDNIKASGLTEEQLRSALISEFQDKASALKIRLSYKDAEEVVDFNEIGVKYNINETVKNAWNVGRSGNIFEKLKEISDARKNGLQLSLSMTYDDSKVSSLVDNFYDMNLVPVKNPDILIKPDSVIIRSGTHGEHFDKVELLQKIQNQIMSADDTPIEIPVIITEPDDINVDSLFEEIDVPATDAKLTVINNRAKIAPEQNGRTISIDVLTAAVDELKNKEGQEIELPLTILNPKVTVKSLNSTLFKNTLSSMTTVFYRRNPIEVNRSENIRIALSKINGTVIDNGKNFSFNDVVGERTIAAGYKDAYTFVSGKLVADTGGGICQVSSTLYNAVLFSDLPVVERGNHSFAVSYVPPGRDAAVFYGSKDFVFKNNTGNPIKINASIINGNQILMQIKGIKKDYSKSIEIITETKKVIPNKTTYIYDSSIPKGSVVMTQHGGKGYVVDTYKIIRKDGKIAERKFLHTSYYSPLEEIYKKGTGAARKSLSNKKSTTSTVTAKPRTPKLTPRPTKRPVATPKPTPVQTEDQETVDNTDIPDNDGIIQ